MTANGGPARRRGNLLLLPGAAALVLGLAALPALPDGSTRSGAGVTRAASAAPAAPATTRSLGPRPSAPREPTTTTAPHRHGSSTSTAGHEHGRARCSDSFKGEHHALCEAPPIALATPAQRAAAARLLAEVKAASAKYADLDLARADGFDVGAIRDYDRSHVTNMTYREDDVRVDPERPEFLVYEAREDGGPVPVGVMFSGGLDPRMTVAGPIFRWHNHADDAEGPYYMGHIWFTNRVESAFQMTAPTKELEAIFGKTARR